MTRTLTRLVVRPVAALLAALFLAVAVAGPASATATGEGGGRTERGICFNTADLRTDGLPVNRWAEGTSFHSRLGSKAWNDVAEKLQRDALMETGMSAGNAVWGATAGLVEQSTSFCVLDKAGAQIDKAAAKVARAVRDSGLLAGAVVMSIFAWAWRVYRGAGAQAGKQLFKKAAVLGLFVIMLTGAAGSTGGADTGQPYKPGMGSPGWFVTTIDQTVSSLAGTVAGSMEVSSIAGAEAAPFEKTDPLSCARYVKAMKSQYRRLYGGSAQSQASNVPLLLSSMWEQTGLEAWKNAQFGPNNPHGEFMYCRVLEANVGAPVGSSSDSFFASTQRSIMKEVDPGFGDLVKSSSLAFGSSTDNKERDRAYVAWAACRLDGDKAANLGKAMNIPGAGTTGYSKNDLVTSDDNGSQAEACADFFSEAGYDGDFFDWDDSDDDISETLTGDSESEAKARDFLLTLHGNKNMGGIVSVILYVLSSLTMFVVFGLFSVAIVAAKVAGLVMMLVIFFVLFAALLPNGDESKIANYAKQYVGLSLFAFGAQFIMALIALITRILISVGADTMPGGAGGLMSMIWTGLCPLIAVMCLHMAFKKMRVPSPFKMSSGVAWGQAAANGALGGAAAAGAAKATSGLLNRADDRVAAFGKKTGAKAVGAVKGAGANVVGGGNRRSQMTPDGARTPGNPGTTAAGVAGGATAAAATMAADTPAGTTQSTTQSTVAADATGDTAAAAGAAGGLVAGAASMRPGMSARAEQRAAREHAGQVRDAAREQAALAKASEQARAAAVRERRIAQQGRTGYYLNQAGGTALGAGSRVASATGSAVAQFRERPLATTSSAAKAVAVGGAATFAAATVVGLAAPAVVGGVAFARSQRGQAMRSTLAGRMPTHGNRAMRNAAELASYRNHVAGEHDAATAAQQASMGKAYESLRADEAATAEKAARDAEAQTEQNQQVVADVAREAAHWSDHMGAVTDPRQMSLFADEHPITVSAEAAASARITPDPAQPAVI